MAKKKTHEEFIFQIKELVGDEYTVLTEYRGAHEKVKIQHNVCDHKWIVSANSFIRGSRCPECAKKIAGKSLRKTQEQFIRDVYNLVGSEYTLKDAYVDYVTKINLTHNVCGNDYSVSPQDFLSRGLKCPICSVKSRTKTTERFKKEVFELVGNEYEVLGDYKTTHNKIEMKHTKCDTIYNVRPSSFLKGARCSYCYGNKKRDTEIFKQEVFNKVGNEYVVLGDYKNTDTYINIKHSVCGYSYEVTPYSFLVHGSRCPKCCSHMKKNTEIYISQVYDLVQDEYSVLGEYVNDATHISTKHNICNHIYEVTPSNFLRGKRCPKCNESKGEKSISKWLDENHIIYLSQYKVDDCVYKSHLPFDFALFNKNKLFLLLEFDGKQHYEPIEFFGGEETYKLTKQRDNIKNEYCKNNNIPLLRIPYWDFDRIEEILESYINKLNISKSL